MSLEFIPKSLTDSKSTVIQLMVRYRGGDKLLPESIMAKFTDGYMRHEAGMYHAFLVAKCS